MTPRWDYKRVVMDENDDEEKILRELGTEGWELVTVAVHAWHDVDRNERSTSVAYFKRRIKHRFF